MDRAPFTAHREDGPAAAAAVRSSAGIADDGVEDCEELAGNRDGGQDFGFAGVDQALAEVVQDGVIPASDDAATNRTVRTVLRPPAIRLVPFHWPD